MTNLKDVLHFYLGCDIRSIGGADLGQLVGVGLTQVIVCPKDKFDPRTTLMEYVKPILRRLSDMTEEEMNECGNMIYDFSGEPELNKWEWYNFEVCLAPLQFSWLVKKGFDLFGLIDSNQAVDAKTI